ncbi:hypothetical protein OIE13_22290 [Streptosporangium sp. NBC_01810]|uniref:hypothetical protein n=1 Tax=Streptosporangium sp. NBC_01810 TaxID=2975951 RepID=UPI002DDA87EB|nr:hypothetical protein [Streptosporangium sp. NBC_01810]WSA23673.1 hypothetical protein OIE13_22290 [Streptosporangium sp. NBC_01810]
MADRSVSVRLRLNIAAFEAGAKAAGRDLSGLNRKLAETSGFATGMRKKLEDAVKKLPKIEIDANSKPAEIKVAALRAKLEALSQKEIGVDIDAGAALIEMAALQQELRALEDGASFDVRADIGNALTDLESVAREMQRIDDRTVTIDIEADRTFAERLRSQVEQAARSLPKIPIDADSTPAQRQVAELRSRLESLAAQRIGIDVDAGAAMAEISAIQRELSRLDRSATIDIRADAGAALSELSAIDAEVSRLSGKSANISVDANVGGALAGIALVGAALAALPAVTTIAVGVTALGSAFAAAGLGAAGFAAVAVPSLGRINEALTAQESAAKAAGGATGGAGQSAAQAAQQALQLEAAEKRLADAQKDERQAQEDLTRAREAGRRALEDLNFSLERSILSQKDAALAVREAEARLAELQADPDASALDIERAMLGVEQAHQRSREQEVKTQRARKDTAVANAAGVKGTKEYQRSQEDLKAAQDKVADAERQLKLLHLQQQAAMASAGGGGGAGGLTDAFAKLSKQEKALAKDIKAFKDEYVDWQQSLQPDVFPVIRSGMDLLSTGMKTGTPLIKASAKAFDELIKKTNEGLKSEQWTSFFDDLTEQAPRAIEGLGTAAGNVAGGLAGIIQAFLPYTDQLMTWLENMTQGFEDWGQNLKGSPEFEAFMSYVQTNGPKVGEVLGNIATFAGKILEAGAGPGAGALDFLVTLSEKLAEMSPEQVEAIAKGVAAIFAAAKLGATIKIGAFVLLAEVLSKMSPGQIQAAAIAIAAVVVAVKGYQAVSAAAGFWQSLSGGIDKAGAAADRNKGKLAGLGQAAGAAGGVLAVTSALGLLDSNLNGLDTKLGGMSKEMSEFATTGQLSGKLAEQWGDSLDTVVKDVDSWDEALGRAGDSSESFREAVSRLANPGPLEGFKTSYLGLMNVVTLGTTEFDKSAEKIGFMDQELANLVSSGRAGEAEQAFTRLAKEAAAMGVPVEKLKEVFPQYTQAVGAAGTASATAAGGIDEAKQRLDGFQSSMDTFSARTDYMQAIRNVETAYKDAAAAVEASSGKLEINSRMTDKQRDAVILAREAFGGYLEKVATGADAQEKLSGRTGDATIAVAEQLPKLFELAGSSKEARDRVYELAEKFGISREMADKATTGSKNFKDELAKLKDKQVKIELDTKAALDKAYAFAKQLLGIKLELPIGIRAPAAPRAYGGIYNTDGRQYMASGGIRSLGSNPAAMIASSPYMISGRSGPDVVFGEAGMEAYIPLSSGKRDRGLQILQEAAGIMGMAVVPEHVAVNTAGGSTTGGGGIPMPAGGAMVTVTGIGALRSSLDTTTMDLTAGLGGATSTLDATLGDAGTLTQSLAGVGEIAGHLAGEVTGWGEVIAVQVPPLTDAVTLLGEAISAAASAADAKGNAGSKGDERSPRGGSSSKGSTGSKGDERSPRGGTALSAVRSTQALKQPPPTEIKGAARGTAGVAMLGGSVNWSRVSKPVQSSPSWSSSGSSAAPSGQAGQGGSSGGSSGGGPLVALNGMTVRSEADIDQFAAQVAMRISGRG